MGNLRTTDDVGGGGRSDMLVVSYFDHILFVIFIFSCLELANGKWGNCESAGLFLNSSTALVVKS